jgi:hypothetical protein
MSNRIEMMNLYQRHEFNPSNKNDMKMVKTFLQNNKWGTNGCPFHLEWPYLDMPSMLKDKITKYVLK